MPRTAALLLFCALALATPVVGCGGGGGDAGADPAAVIPRGALMYAEVAVRPEGDVREGALAAAGKLLDTEDPGRELRALVDRLIAEDDEEGPKATYTKDIEPWLGERGGFWFADEIAHDDDAFGFAFAVTDVEAAEDALARQAEADEVERSYRDVDYRFDPEEKTAYAIVGDRLLGGSEPQFKAMVDVSEGDGPALTASDAYDRALEPLRDDRLGHFYMDVARLIDVAAKADPDPDAQFGADVIKRLFGSAQVSPVAIGLLADGERIAFEAIAQVTKEPGLLSTLYGLPSKPSPLFGELPGDAWGAFAVPQVGKTAKALFEQAAGLFGGAAAAAAIRRETGLDLERDVFSWIGDVAFFIRGDTVDALEGGLVIESTDDDAARRAFGRIAALIARDAGAQPLSVEGAESAVAVRAPDLPQPLVLARGEGRVVAALGAGAAADALSPGEQLADSELLAEGRESLGDGLDPAFLVSVPQVLALVEGFAGTDPEWQEFKRYADAVSVLAVGSEVEGETSRAIYAFGLE